MGAETGICRPCYMCYQTFCAGWCFRDPITSMLQPALYSESWSTSLLLWKIKPHSGFNCHLLLENASGSSFSISTFTQVSDFWTHSCLKKLKLCPFRNIMLRMSLEFIKLRIAFWNECHVNSQIESQDFLVNRMKAEHWWRAFKSSLLFWSSTHSLSLSGQLEQRWCHIRLGGWWEGGMFTACWHTFSASTKLSHFPSPSRQSTCLRIIFLPLTSPARMRENQMAHESLNAMLPHWLPGTHSPVRAEGFLCANQICWPSLSLYF